MLSILPFFTDFQVKLLRDWACIRPLPKKGRNLELGPRLGPGPLGLELGPEFDGGPGRGPEFDGLDGFDGI